MRPAFRPGGEAASAAPASCSAPYRAGPGPGGHRLAGGAARRRAGGRCPLPAPSADLELMRFCDCGQVQELSLRLKARGGRLLVLESGAWVSNWNLGSLRRTGLHARLIHARCARLAGAPRRRLFLPFLQPRTVASGRLFARMLSGRSPGPETCASSSRRGERRARRRAALPLRAFCFAQWLAKTVDLSHPETLDVGFEAESSTFRSSDVGWACFFALSLSLSRCLWPLAPSLFIASLSRGANWWPVGSPAPSGTVALDHRQGLRMSADWRRVGVLKAPGALKLTAPIQHQASA